MFATKPMLSNADNTTSRKQQEKKEKGLSYRTKKRIFFFNTFHFLLLTKYKHGSSESTFLSLPLSEKFEFFCFLLICLYKLTNLKLINYTMLRKNEK